MIIAIEYFQARMDAETQARAAKTSLAIANDERLSDERTAAHLAESIVMLNRALKSAKTALKFHKQ